jgi:uncharacterized Ntn-hydrolase superfamily protein
MTFSLAGRCARTGMTGAVVTTSAPAVGARCAHAAAGIGAVLTQNVTDPRLGPLGLALMRGGSDAEHTLDALVASSPHHIWRQLAVIDRHGNTAAFSGRNVKPARNEAHGRDCVAIANIVRSADIPAQMVRAFEQDPSAHLADRLLAALRAGELGGGEFKPLVSAALLIAWREDFAYIDLRVDSDPDPIAALFRLWAEYHPMTELYVTRVIDPDAISTPPDPPTAGATRSTSMQGRKQ